MPCTTILVGKAASYDGSTIIARNDDSGAGSYTPKKYAVVHPAAHLQVCYFPCGDRASGRSDEIHLCAERSKR